jgi:hypothetical protein
MLIEQTLTAKQAREIAGSLGSPSKMPGHAYGLPARECRTGGRLQKVEGSTCSGCYAMRGQYNFPVVQTAQYKRLESITHPLWADAMVTLIYRAEVLSRNATGFFRWHDSGDLQSVEHLTKIVEIAERLPEVSFWIPTRETVIVRDFLKSGGVVPANLCVRISAHMIGHAPKRAPLGLPYSTVSDDAPFAGAHDCPARFQDNACGDCRACWDTSVPHVDYHKH